MAYICALPMGSRPKFSAGCVVLGLNEHTSWLCGGVLALNCHISVLCGGVPGLNGHISSVDGAIV